MIVGILGHAARFAVYAFFPDNSWLIIFIQMLHGVCYAFFFATVYIFVDEYFPKDVRNSAQGLFNVMILGVGALVANTVCPLLFQPPNAKIPEAVFTVAGKTNFTGLFLVPCAIATLAAIALALFFHPPKRNSEGASISAPTH